jgi:hypothetical protein
MSDPVLLAQSLALAALIAATLEYAMLLRRRLANRAWVRHLAEVQESGARGLRRILRTDRGEDHAGEAPSR